MKTYIQHWYTVGVTALPPGWRNVYQEDDGTFSAYPCPALLLQEHRQTTGPSNKTTPEKLPYSTRVVFADRDGAHLEPADDASNYVDTLAPGEPDPTPLAPDQPLP